ncbi:N-acetyltransferase [Actinoplanes sp. TRM 88003]|uniref:N-acetyltransferase n=1 Tax=Paractinoplanes aksuensis TaxID=2939490 RepID=A0ABT1E2C1_9ACTN|nr:N-acetyltransferase [Actinoplanes aksuensis]MCO8276396.1 N-acetyltransferase [Actinoplanes aksuensis]
MEIRAERDGDDVAGVHRAAFGADGEKIVELVAALKRDDPALLSLVAEVDGQVAGNVMFTRSLLDAPSRLVDVWVLSPLSVLPARQRQGVGRALIEHGLRIADEQRVPLVFLEGDPAYYSKAGFRAGGELGFRKPSLRIPDVAFQVYPLTAYEPWMTGTLVYSATFWDYDSVGLRDS